MMTTHEAWVGQPVAQPHEVEIDPQTVLAFWRLGRALVLDQPRDREVFTLGRCIGSTPGTTSTLEAFGERSDPGSFAISRLMYGGDQAMLDAYWQSVDDPVVFALARRVYQTVPTASDAPPRFSDGAVVFDISRDHARLAGIRFRMT